MHKGNCPLQKLLCHIRGFLNTWFTLDVVQHQFLIANTSVLLLYNNIVMSQTIEISAITTTSISHKSFFHSVSIVYLESSQCLTLYRCRFVAQGP